MPHDAITRVGALGRQQQMPKTLTFADRFGFEIPDVDDDASEKAHIWYGTLQCDTSHFFCGPSSNNYVTTHLILHYLRD
jgi:hypothetical protein